ncbi:MAG: hypothetical protein CM15mV103_280 [uncultured marine virus]|nr:MAG: hypothetical protein CM15mV103_280 [uncultured marine virus]
MEKIEIKKIYEYPWGGKSIAGFKRGKNPFFDLKYLNVWEKRFDYRKRVLGRFLKGVLIIFEISFVICGRKGEQIKKTPHNYVNNTWSKGGGDNVLLMQDPKAALETKSHDPMNYIGGVLTGAGEA